MIENGAELKIYYSESYRDNGDCYIIYCNGGGLYMNTPTESYKIVQQKYLGNINIDNVDEFAFSRDFIKILDVIELTYDHRTNLQWYHNAPKNMKQRLQEMLNYIIKLSRWNHQSDPFAIHLYSTVNQLLQVI